MCVAGQGWCQGKEVLTLIKDTSSWRIGLQAIHMSELTSSSQLSKMSVTVSISQMRKLKLREVKQFILGPTALCGQAGMETKIFWTQKDLLLTSPLFCLIWCKKVHVWEGGREAGERPVYLPPWNRRNFRKAWPTGPGQETLGLRAVWGQRGLAGGLLLLSSCGQSHRTVCLSPPLPSSLAGIGTNLWMPFVP